MSAENSGQEVADTEPAAAHVAARCSHFSRDHLEEPLASSQNMSTGQQGCQHLKAPGVNTRSS